MNSWKVILATLVIFGAGVVTGGLLVTYAVHTNIDSLTRRGPAQQPQPQATNPWLQRSRELLRRMDRDLDLTPEQHQHIEKLIADSAERTKGLWKPIAPMMNKETQRLHRDIRDELNPDQRRKFDDEMARQRAGQQNRRALTNQPSGVSPNSLSTNVAPANP